MSDGGSDYLTPADLQQMQDYASGVPYSVPSFSSDGSGFNFDSFGRLVQTGVKAYGDIEAINRAGSGGAGSAPYYPPATSAPAPYNPPAAPAPAAAPAAPFDWTQFKNFSTPYPYVALAGGALVLAIVYRLMR